MVRGLEMLNKKILGSVSSLPPGDTNFKNVALLLSGDGTNGTQNNTFVDSSTNNFTITRNGNVTQGSFSPYNNNWWGAETKAATSYFTLGNPSQLNPGSGNFTIEGWFNVIAYGSVGYIPIYAKYENSGRNDFFIGANSDGTMSFSIQDTSNTGWDVGSAPGLISLNTWYHFALVRNGTNLTSYINGSVVASITIGTITVRNSANIAISKLYGYGSNTNGGGYFSNFRYVNSAVYTSAFTPSTKPLTAISGTQLLIFQYPNSFTDSSSNGLTVTAVGSPSTTFVRPVSLALPYSSSTNGGSAYFDGSGDYLTSPSSSAYTLGSSGDFTIDGWFYMTSDGGGIYPIITNFNHWDTGYANRFYIGFSGSVFRWYGSGGSTAISTSSYKLNTWNYFNFTRSGSTITGYLNGSSIGTQTTSMDYTTDDVLRIGGSMGNGNNYNGYVANLRIIKGATVSGSSIPTSPTTAVSGTTFLSNFTNAGIIDNATQNDLETLGGTQVSTSVKRYGSGSIYINSGSLMCYPLQSGSGLNTFAGDFTFEYWFYPTNSSSDFQGGGLSYRDSGFSSGGFQAIYDGTAGNMIWYFDGGGVILTGNGINNNQWNYLALVRENSTISFYVNGNRKNQATYTTIINGGASSTLGFFIGDTYDGNHYYVEGYMDDIRITNGIARYSGTTMTTPTSAHKTY